MRVAVSNIRDMLADGQVELVQEYIDTFSCMVIRENGESEQLNPDIEHFLRSNAIHFANMKVAVTYFVFDADEVTLLGYFTLAHKSLEISANGLSRRIKDKIKRFSVIDRFSNTYTVSAFLLAQFSKNYAVEKEKGISGHDIMEIVVDRLSDIQNKIGGTIVYLDCESHAKLIDFYEREQFTLFGERVSSEDGKHYLQYLRFI